MLSWFSCKWSSLLYKVFYIIGFINHVSSFNTLDVLISFPDAYIGPTLFWTIWSVTQWVTHLFVLSPIPHANTHLLVRSLPPIGMFFNANHPILRSHLQSSVGGQALVLWYTIHLSKLHQVQVPGNKQKPLYPRPYWNYWNEPIWSFLALPYLFLIMDNTIKALKQSPSSTSNLVTNPCVCPLCHGKAHFLGLYYT